MPRDASQRICLAHRDIPALADIRNEREARCLLRCCQDVAVVVVRLDMLDGNRDDVWIGVIPHDWRGIPPRVMVDSVTTDACEATDHTISPGCIGLLDALNDRAIQVIDVMSRSLCCWIGKPVSDVGCAAAASGPMKDNVCRLVPKTALPTVWRCD